jgi:hypothetical protein
MPSGQRRNQPLRGPVEKRLVRPISIVSQLCRRKLHQRERRTAVWAVWIAERFNHLKVMVVRRFDALHRLARGFDRYGEIATLPLEVRRL